MLTVIDPGILNTIQDRGRWGYQAYGVPVSGAMDLPALAAANQLLGNPLEAAAVEIHSPLVLEADRPHLLAVTGAPAAVRVNDLSLPMWASLLVRAHARIEIKPEAGGWTYLAVLGGIAVPPVLGSRSTYVRGNFGGLDERGLAAGDVIPVGDPGTRDLFAAAGRQLDADLIARLTRRSPARVLFGPHSSYFSDAARAALLHSEFTVSEASDRMGYRLRGPVIPRATSGELISCGVPLGAIQVPPDGQPIVAMADHQTTGGYPIIAVIAADDLGVVAQTRAGEGVQFAEE